MVESSFLTLSTQNNTTWLRFSHQNSEIAFSNDFYQYPKNLYPNQPIFFYQQLPVLVFLTLMYAIILATTVTANIVMLTRYFLHKSVHFVTNPYILILVCVDLLWPIVNVPVQLADIWSLHWNRANRHDILETQIAQIFLCQFIPFSQVILPDIIAIALCLIAAERYFTILHPFRVNPMLKRRFEVFASLLIIFSPMVVNSPFIGAYDFQVTEDLYQPGNNQLIVCQTKKQSDEVAGLFFSMPRFVVRTFRIFQAGFFVMLLPGILFPFCYGRIMCKVSTLTNASLEMAKQLEHHGAARRRILERRKRMASMVAIMALAIHFICWAPICAFNFAHFWDDFKPLSDNEATCLRFLNLLAASNPALNSLLYKAVLRSKHRNSSSSGNLNSDASSMFHALFARNNQQSLQAQRTSGRRQSPIPMNTTTPRPSGTSGAPSSALTKSNTFGKLGQLLQHQLAAAKTAVVGAGLSFSNTSLATSASGNKAIGKLSEDNSLGSSTRRGKSANLQVSVSGDLKNNIYETIKPQTPPKTIIIKTHTNRLSSKSSQPTSPCSNVAAVLPDTNFSALTGFDEGSEIGSSALFPIVVQPASPSIRSERSKKSGPDDSSSSITSCQPKSSGTSSQSLVIELKDAVRTLSNDSCTPVPPPNAILLRDGSSLSSHVDYYYVIDELFDNLGDSPSSQLATLQLAPYYIDDTDEDADCNGSSTFSRKRSRSFDLSSLCSSMSAPKSLMTKRRCLRVKSAISRLDIHREISMTLEETPV